jgi:hypothetical protein
MGELRMKMLHLAGWAAWATAICISSVQATTAPFATPDVANVQPEGTWLTWGGSASFGFNPDGLVALDLRIAKADGASKRAPGEPGQRYDTTTFPALDAGALEVIHQGPSITGIGGGELRFRGGFVLEYPGGSVDLRGFALRADPSARVGIAVVDAEGRAWFTADHAHYGFDEQGPGTFSMYNMNLRLSDAFAQALGRADLAGYPIGSLEFRARAQLNRAPAQPEGGGVCSAPFSGPGLVTDISLIYDDEASGWTAHDDSVYARRCSLPPTPNGGACTASSTTGKVVMDQDSSLRNTGTTGVAWHEKFTSPSPPYGNDQHPYLIWNLYRVDADGRIKQIGVSALKHAFLTINWAHVPGECGCAEGHVIYPTCEDTYSLANNDNSSSGGSQQQNLAPRSELIPKTAVWGRCGSVWDANCDGAMDPNSGAQNLYQYRMLVDESDMQPPLSTGAHYYFEYWYIVRDDVNIYNTMGYREIQPFKNGAVWQVNLVNAGASDHDFFLGPALNRWVDPAAPGANAMNQELSTPLGRARVAVKATDIGGGQWRYEYSVMNFDYAHVRIDPSHASEPNLKVLENHGFYRFKVPLPTGVVASALRFDDADDNAANDWTVTTTGGVVSWKSPPSSNMLDWGMLYHFEFTANAPPSAATIGIVGAPTSTEGDLPYTLDLLGPHNVDDTIFSNGFD